LKVENLVLNESLQIFSDRDPRRLTLVGFSLRDDKYYLKEGDLWKCYSISIPRGVILREQINVGDINIIRDGKTLIFMEG